MKSVKLAAPTAGEILPVTALWHPVEAGVCIRPDPKSKDGKKDKMWRTKRTLSLSRLVNSVTLPPPSPTPNHFTASKQVDFSADVLVIEDNAEDFRFHLPAALLEFLKSSAEKLPSKVVLKTRAPVCHGGLWWALAESPALERLVVIVPVEDLRRADSRVSQGISWERTAADLARELQTSPALDGLRKARHVVVTLHGEGALWMERTGDERHAFTLFFDPGHMEGEWSRKVALGGAYGFHSTFAASIAAHDDMAPWI